MVKLTYEQMRHLSELGNHPDKLTITNRHGKVLRPTMKKWTTASTPTAHTLGCATVSINGSQGSQDHGLRRGVRKSRV